MGRKQLRCRTAVRTFGARIGCVAPSRPPREVRVSSLELAAPRGHPCCRSGVVLWVVTKQAQPFTCPVSHQLLRLLLCPEIGPQIKGASTPPPPALSSAPTHKHWKGLCCCPVLDVIYLLFFHLDLLGKLSCMVNHGLIQLTHQKES